MASIIPETIHAAKKIVMGSQGDKFADMAQNTIEPTKNTKLTSDYGVKEANTDHWLSVTNDKHTGPALLEDSFGREKVSAPLESYCLPKWFVFVSHGISSNLLRDCYRFTVSTMSEFPSVSSMPVAQEPLESSASTRASRISPSRPS